MSDTGKISYSIGLDYDKLRSDAEESKRLLHGIGNTAADEGRKMDQVFRDIGKTIGGVLSATAAVSFAKQIVNVRSEIQSLEISFRTLLGSASKADELFGELRKFAVQTPLLLKDLAAGAQTMLGFGIASDEVMPILKAIGDISMGDSQRLQSLSLAFSQMTAAGKLMGQDLLQMINAGFNPLAQIAEKTGKSIGTLKEEMSKGAISAEMVKQAYLDAASEGGKFYGMLESQSKGIKGSLSNLQGAIDDFFNELGEKIEEPFVETVEITSTIVKNYKIIGKSIAEIIAAYGIYKAVVISLSAIENLRYQAALAHMAGMTKMSVVTDMLSAKTEKLHAVLAKNPYMLTAAAVATLAYGIYKLATYESDAEKAQKKLNESFKDCEKDIASERAQIDILFAKLNAAKKGTEEYESARNAIISQYGKYLEGLNKEIKSLEDVEGAYKAITAAAQEAARARAMEAFTKSAADDYGKKESEAREDLYNALKGHYGNKTDSKGANLAETYFWKIVPVLEGKEEMTEEIREMIAPLEKTSSIWNGPGAGATYYQTNAAMDAIKKATEAHKVLNNVLKDAEIKFGGDPESKKRREQREKDQAEAKAKAEKEAKEQAEKDKDKEATEKALKAEKAKQEKIKEAKKKAHEDLLRIQRENNEQSIELIEDGRQKEALKIEQVYQEKVEDLKKKADEWKELNQKAGLGNELSEDQQAEINKGIENAKMMRTQALAQVAKNESDAMREYLKEYGSLMQKKLAIDEQYEEAKTKATTQGEKLRLEKQKGYALNEAEVQDLLDRVDWVTAFSDVGIAFEGQLRSVFNDLKAFVKTDAFKSQGGSDQKAIVEAMERIRSIIGDEGKSSWQELAHVMGEYQKALTELNESTNKEKEIKKALDSKKAQLENIKPGEDASLLSQEIQSLKDKLKNAGTEVNNATKKVNTSGTIVASTSKKVLSPVSKVTSFLENSSIPRLGELSAQFDRLKGAINGLKAISKIGKSAKEASKATKDIGKAAKESGKKLSESAGDLADKVKKGGFIAEIVSAILDILNILRDGIGPLISGILDTVLGAINGLLENLLNGKFLEQIANSLIKGIGGIFKTIAERLTKLFTFGAVDINWTGSNAAEVQRTINRLTDRNEALQTSIEDLTDEMRASRGMKSVRAYRSAYEDQAEMNQNYMDMAIAQAGYHNHHHSWMNYWKGFSEDQMAWIRANVSEDFSGDLFSLSPEEMKKLRANVEIWEKIKDTGKGGYGDRLADQLDKYIDQAGKLEDLTVNLYEGLTSVSFDSMYDSFINSLMDMKYSAEDAADDISNYFMKAMLANKIGDMYSDKLKGWWERFAKSMENDGTLDADEISSLSAEYQQYIQEAIKIRDELANATGYGKNDSASREASSKGIATASQDSVDELNGRATAIQGHTYSIMETNKMLVSNTNEILARVMNIDRTTESMDNRMEKMEGNVREIKNTMNDIALKGVKMR